MGRIERTYGHPDYLAVDVRFEDGGVELYWHHELAKEGNAPLLSPGAPDAGGRDGTGMPSGIRLERDANATRT